MVQMDPWENLNFWLNLYSLKVLDIVDIQISPPVHYYSQKGRPLWPDPPPVRVGPILADPLPPLRSDVLYGWSPILWYLLSNKINFLFFLRPYNFFATAELNFSS